MQPSSQPLSLFTQCAAHKFGPITDSCAFNNSHGGNVQLQATSEFVYANSPMGLHILTASESNKSLTKLTASVLKDDPNTQKIRKRKLKLIGRSKTSFEPLH